MLQQYQQRQYLIVVAAATVVVVVASLYNFGIYRHLRITFKDPRNYYSRAQECMFAFSL